MFIVMNRWVEEAPALVSMLLPLLPLPGIGAQLGWFPSSGSTASFANPITPDPLKGKELHDFRCSGRDPSLCMTNKCCLRTRMPEM